MYNVGLVIFDDDVARERFACDLEKCKGRCCTMHGHRGAPVMDAEIEEIEREFPKIIRFLPAEHLKTIKEHGLVAGIPGDYCTVCVDNRACVFVYYENGTARCAFEKAFMTGLTTWRKPLSCHLFPVRIRRNGTDRLYYERIHECLSGREKGIISDTTLIRFVGSALIRKYGSDWYAKALSECSRPVNQRNIVD